MGKVFVILLPNTKDVSVMVLDEENPVGRKVLRREPKIHASKYIQVRIIF